MNIPDYKEHLFSSQEEGNERLKLRLERELLDEIVINYKKHGSSISNSKEYADKQLTEIKKDILLINNIFHHKLPNVLINYINEYNNYTLKQIKAVIKIQRFLKNTKKYKDFNLKKMVRVIGGPIFALFILKAVID